MVTEIKGKYNTAKVFTDTLDETAIEQVKELCNREEFKDEKIRIMPDAHAGKGCVIGLTMTDSKYIDPSFVGVDIGCGMYMVELEGELPDLSRVDLSVRTAVPAGRNIRARVGDWTTVADIAKRLELMKFQKFSIYEALKALGTLGGGNHFIEIDNIGKKNYLIIHSGSRGVGLKTANHYIKESKKTGKLEKEVIKGLVEKLKAEGRISEIRDEISKLSQETIKPISVLEGEGLKDYLHDVDILKDYAKLNRECMAEAIINMLPGIKAGHGFHTIHNYVDIDKCIIRKGAIDASSGIPLILIPLNMRDGCILAEPIGNPDWNFSAPHGAGRRLSRTEAKKTLSMEAFKEDMTGIYTSSVDKNTLDESPGAYKDKKEIIENITETVKIVEYLKPIYNFKAGE